MSVDQKDFEGCSLGRFPRDFTKSNISPFGYIANDEVRPEIVRLKHGLRRKRLEEVKEVVQGDPDEFSALLELAGWEYVDGSLVYQRAVWNLARLADQSGLTRVVVASILVSQKTRNPNN